MSQTHSFIVLATVPEIVQELRSALSAERRARLLLMSDQVERVYAETVRERPAGVIITLGEQPASGWALCRRIRAVCPETAIICASRNPSPDLILDSLRAGASEFLRLPVQASEFRTVLARTVEMTPGEMRGVKKRGRVISLFSTKGGCGTSFLAANLALALGAPTALCDLNLQGGDLDLFFGVKPKFSLADFVQNRARLDDGLIASYLAPCSDRVALLSAPLNAEASESIRPEHIAEVVEVLRERHDFILFDLPHTFDALTLSALDQTDEILLVFTLDLLAARSAQRALFIFDRVGYARQKVHLVINRLGKKRDLELEQIARYLNETVACTISDDSEAALASINQGRPLTGGTSISPIVAELKQLAALCGGGVAEPASAPRKNLLSNLFRRTSAPLPLPFPTLADKSPTGD